MRGGKAMIIHDAFAGAHSFSTASELCEALLASYPGVDFFGAPVAGKPHDRDHETAPAWGWLGQLVGTRTDWIPAIGIALQRATEEGLEHARTALADLLVSCEDSAVLVEWTEPIARRWPDVHTSGARGYPWRDERLGDLVARQRARWTALQSAAVSPSDLEARIATSVRARASPPWEWLRTALLAHEDPDLVAHTEPICVTEWCVDEALLTADTGGTIHRWDLALSAPS
jgi:hypothetical protein